MSTATGTQIWQDTLDVLHERLDKLTFETWLSATEVEAFDGNEITIKVPTPVARDHIKKHLLEVIETVIAGLGNHNVHTSFVYAKARSAISSSSDFLDSSDIGNYTNNLDLNPKYTFDTFVIGDKNRLAHAASIAVSERPAQHYNPLFLYGGPGLGKTHLLHAIGQHAIEVNPVSRIVYITSETFVREFVNSLQFNRMDDFRNKYRTVDILLIDDIQFISGKEGTQEEFFHTFNTLHSEHKQIVITSDRAPREIPDLEDRLRSRFSGGLLIDIKPPEFETRVAILRKKAKAEGIEIPEDAMHYIASKVETNVRELEGAFIRVIAFSSLKNRDIDSSLAEQALMDLTTQEKRPLTALDVQKVICMHYRIKLDDLKGKSRQRDLSHPRQVAMYLTRELTALSLPKIGKEFGGRDHSTVIHACDKISKDIDRDRHLEQTIRQLREAITAHIP